MGILIIVLGALMLSNIPYALVPKIGLRSRKGILNLLWLFGNVLVAIAFPAYYFFPMLLGYTMWGLMGSVIHGLLERLPERDPLLDVLDDAGAEVRALDYGELAPKRYQQSPTHVQPPDTESEA